MISCNKEGQQQHCNSSLAKLPATAVAYSMFALATHHNQ
jgi:hypothetical protein